MIAVTAARVFHPRDDASDPAAATSSTFVTATIATITAHPAIAIMITLAALAGNLQVDNFRRRRDRRRRLWNLEFRLLSLVVAVGHQFRALIFGAAADDGAVIGAGDIRRGKAGLSHMMRGKSAARRRNLRKNGMVEYWRAKGWPPFCHPTTRDDFECA